uniref:Nicotinic acetylcholine receptor subunit n=1 Tax=Ciona intestinalis TaxID=7719 RepID=E7FIY7_CIOIN|nr:nicotinic acetylcholine receptor subunit precursor [Ciona intestinalis]BAJ65312.1 nicotinic acetylcholine receptor subunit [Ciona intestinalis]|eukprot:NP_001190977.1 nicotinic acetylcholine receptor subunit precursor [Ciona intestinalis]
MIVLRLLVMGALAYVSVAKTRYDLSGDIMQGYDAKVRPSDSYNNSVKVVFKLVFNQLLDVSEVNQKIETKLWVYHKWMDPRLSWVPEDYENLEYIYLPTTNLWLPELVLYNNADGDFAISQFTKAKVDYTGMVEWKPPAIFKSFCEIMVAEFPFDTQNCTMKIGPWSQGQDLLDMVNSDWEVKDHMCEPPDETMYEESGEWLILKTGCWKHYIKYDCCRGPYVDMTYYFILQRRPLYLVINILFPTMLFSYLTCAVFYLPSDAGEKITLSISLLLSLIVFLLVIVEAIPSTANGVPLLCQYILFTMILVCLSIMITVGVLNVHYRGPATHVMSDRMKKIFMVWLPKFIYSSTMKRLDPYKEEKMLAGRPPKPYKDISDLSGRSPKPDEPHLIGSDVKTAMDGVDYVSECYKDQREGQQKEDEWKYVAMVLDHFLLYIFILACVVGTVGIFGKRLLEFMSEQELFKNLGNECILKCQSD